MHTLVVGAGSSVGSGVAPDGVPGTGQHLMFDAPEQKLVMVEAPSHVSVLTLMQLPALPIKQLAYSLLVGSGSVVGAVTPDGVPGTGQHLMLEAPAQNPDRTEVPSHVSLLMSMQFPALPFKQLTYCEGYDVHKRACVRVCVCVRMCACACVCAYGEEEEGGGGVQYCGKLSGGNSARIDCQ